MKGMIALAKKKEFIDEELVTETEEIVEDIKEAVEDTAEKSAEVAEEVVETAAEAVEETAEKAEEIVAETDNDLEADEYGEDIDYEEVEDILDVDSELEGVLGVASLDSEVVLVAEVNPVNPRRVNGVGLSVATLMLAHVLVLVDIIHEAVAAVSVDETELVVIDLLICRDIDGIVGVTVTIHVVGEHVGLFVATPPGLINEVEVVTTLVAKVESCHDTVRSHIL